MERLNSRESKKIFRHISCIAFIGLIASGKYAWQEEEEINGDCQYCTDALGTILNLRALQGHSGRNLVDSSSQNNVIIKSNFFQHISCRMCSQFAFYHQFGIDI